MRPRDFHLNSQLLTLNRGGSGASGRGLSGILSKQLKVGSPELTFIFAEDLKRPLSAHCAGGPP